MNAKQRTKDEMRALLLLSALLWWLIESSRRTVCTDLDSVPGRREVSPDVPCRSVALGLCVVRLVYGLDDQRGALPSSFCVLVFLWLLCVGIALRECGEW